AVQGGEDVGGGGLLAEQLADAHLLVQLPLLRLEPGHHRLDVGAGAEDDVGAVLALAYAHGDEVEGAAGQGAGGLYGRAWAGGGAGGFAGGGGGGGGGRAPRGRPDRRGGAHRHRHRQGHEPLPAAEVEHERLR